MKFNSNYAKITDGRITYAPNRLIVEGRQIFNAAPCQYIAEGWLPVAEQQKPEVPEGFYLTAVFAEENGQITKSWTLTAFEEEEQ